MDRLLHPWWPVPVSHWCSTPCKNRDRCRTKAITCGLLCHWFYSPTQNCVPTEALCLYLWLNEVGHFMYLCVTPALMPQLVALPGPVCIPMSVAVRVCMWAVCHRAKESDWGLAAEQLLPTGQVTRGRDCTPSSLTHTNTHWPTKIWEDEPEQGRNAFFAHGEEHTRSSPTRLHISEPPTASVGTKALVQKTNERLMTYRFTRSNFTHLLCLQHLFFFSLNKLNDHCSNTVYNQW